MEENQSLVTTKLDPLVQQKFPELEREYQRIQFLLKTERELSILYSDGIQIYQTFGEEQIKSFEDKINETLGYSEEYLESLEAGANTIITNHISDIRRLHREFKNNLLQLNSVSASIAGELDDRNKWAEESKERFLPFRTLLDRLGEKVETGSLGTNFNIHSDRTTVLSLVLNADRDCYQCLLAEREVRSADNKDDFQYWSQNHKENLSQIDHRLAEVQRQTPTLIGIRYYNTKTNGRRPPIK